MYGLKLQPAGKSLHMPISVLSNTHAQISFKGFFWEFFSWLWRSSAE